MKRSFEVEIAKQDDFHDQIVSCCYEKFQELSARGKPSVNEWTHLAGFVSVNENNQIDVLSLGTGTKCLGGKEDERGTQGCLLHDSHAEVIARRSFLRFLYEEILNGNSSVLIKKEETKKYEWNQSIRLYMFVSYPPCGSAAYFSDPIKRPKLDHKSINSAGEELHLKPGKGFPTTSLSCTNKINRWISQGLEGSLLNQLITTPIRFSALLIQTNTELSSIFPNTSVVSIDKSFQYGPSSERVRPCAMSLAWWKGVDPSACVITVDGYPLGQVKKLRNKQQYANPLSKCALFKLYLQLMDHLSPTTTTYAQAKSLTSNTLRDEFMSNHPEWIVTDPKIFYSFSLNNVTKK